MTTRKKNTIYAIILGGGIAGWFLWGHPWAVDSLTEPYMSPPPGMFYGDSLDDQVGGGSGGGGGSI